MRVWDMNWFQVERRLAVDDRVVLPLGSTEQHGSLSLRPATYLAVITDLLDTLWNSGFRRIALVNGHGGNAPALGAVRQWSAQPGHDAARVQLHSGYSGPAVAAVADGIEAGASHGGWFENFPWTRLAGVELPAQGKPLVSVAKVRTLLESGWAP